MKHKEKKRIKKLVEAKYGLEIKRKQGIHHIDMDNNNNNIDNLWVFVSNSEHMKAHMSIFKLVSRLIVRGMIDFDEWEGFYKFPTQIDYDNVIFRLGDFIITEKDFEKLSDRKKKLWFDVKKIFEDENESR